MIDSCCRKTISYNNNNIHLMMCRILAGQQIFHLIVCPGPAAAGIVRGKQPDYATVKQEVQIVLNRPIVYRYPALNKPRPARGREPV